MRILHFLESDGDGFPSPTGDEAAEKAAAVAAGHEYVFVCAKHAMKNEIKCDQVVTTNDALLKKYGGKLYAGGKVETKPAPKQEVKAEPKPAE